jgi:ubiquinone biosynthesis protein COQ9
VSNAKNVEQLKDAILLPALPNIAFDGWSMAALGAGATDAGLAKHDLLHAFPNGIADAIAHWSDWADRQAVQAMGEADIAHMKTHQRVAMGVWARLEALGRWREAARKATAWLAVPRHAPLASRLAYRTCDTIWRTAGDVSTDFNFYTKRALLGGVVLSTTLYWLQDSSEGSQATSAFLDRRIADVLLIGGRIGKTRAALERFDPAALLRRFRTNA